MTKPEEIVVVEEMYYIQVFQRAKKNKFLEGFDKIFDIICKINQKKMKFMIEIEYSFYKTK